MSTPGFEEVLNAGGHKDASFHIGGHGEGGPDVKVIVITDDRGETYVCVRRDGEERVTRADSKDAALETFAHVLRKVLIERMGVPSMVAAPAATS
jgi:hypothetical protein